MPLLSALDSGLNKTKSGVLLRVASRPFSQIFGEDPSVPADDFIGVD